MAQEKWSGDDGVGSSHVEELFCCRGDRVAIADIGLEVLTPGAGELVVFFFFPVDSGVRKEKKKTQRLYCVRVTVLAQGKEEWKRESCGFVRRTEILIVLSRDTRRRCRGFVGDADIELGSMERGDEVVCNIY